MDKFRIAKITKIIARDFIAGKLQLGPRKKTRGRKSLTWYQDFKFDPEGWDFKELGPKIIRYLKKPPMDFIPGYAAPKWFLQFKTKNGIWSVDKWTRRDEKTYQDLVEKGDLTGKGTAGWSFVQE